MGDRGLASLTIVIGAAASIAGAVLVSSPRHARFAAYMLMAGPTTLVCGIGMLWQALRSPPAEPQRSAFALERATAPSAAALLYEADIRRNEPFVEVACVSCGEAYLYIPRRAAHVPKAGDSVRAAAEAETAARLGYAVAPCPTCGWIQPQMLDWARNDYAPTGLPSVAGLLLLAISAVAFMAVQAGLVAPANGGADQPAWPWYLGALAGGAMGGLLLHHAWRLSRDWDPNSMPAPVRLRLGRQVAIARDQYVGFAAHNSLAPVESPLSAPPSVAIRKEEA